MSIFMSLFLGLIQGIAEFLPISSSGHLAIFQNLFNLNYTEEGNLLFEVMLHLGTFVSICVVYRTEIKSMITEGIEFLRRRSDSDSDEPVVLKPSGRTLLFVLVATLPMVIGLFFRGSIASLFSVTIFVGFALIITGGLLFVSERYISQGNKTEKTMTLADAFIIGLAQMVATLPGLSRSGTTITVGLARGLSGSFAIRFSLLLALPAILGSTIVELYLAIREGIDFSLFFIYLAGFAVAAVVGFFAIQLIRRVMARGRFGTFAYYCWGAGALTILLSLVLN